MKDVECKRVTWKRSRELGGQDPQQLVPQCLVQAQQAGRCGYVGYARTFNGALAAGTTAHHGVSLNQQLLKTGVGGQDLQQLMAKAGAPDGKHVARRVGCLRPLHQLAGRHHIRIVQPQVREAALAAQQGLALSVFLVLTSTPTLLT